jgi:hypothetical protein
MNAHSRRRWTFDRFVEWSFGPGVPFHAAQLAYDLEAEVCELASHDTPFSRRLRDLAWELRDMAQDQRWGAEGTLVLSLLARAEAGWDRESLLQEALLIVRELQSRLRGRLYQSLVRQLQDGARPTTEVVDRVAIAIA